MRQRLTERWQKSGARPPELTEPECPEAGEHMLGIFWDLDGARQSNGFGFLPLSNTEIKAWCDLNGVILHPREVAILRAMDGERLRDVAPKPTAGAQPNQDQKMIHATVGNLKLLSKSMMRGRNRKGVKHGAGHRHGSPRAR